MTEWYKSEGLKNLPNQYPNNEGPITQPYTLHIEIKEFTCLCPKKPDQPDFATFDIWYEPDQYILELKGLKEYMTGYRNMEIFHEPATNRILRDLTQCAKPKWMKIIGHWYIRGGIQTTVEVEWTNK